MRWQNLEMSGSRQSGTTRTNEPASCCTDSTASPAPPTSSGSSHLSLRRNSSSILNTAKSITSSSYGGPHSADSNDSSAEPHEEEKKLPEEPNGPSVSRKAEQYLFCRLFIGEAKHSASTPKSLVRCSIAIGGVANCQPRPSLECGPKRIEYRCSSRKRRGSYSFSSPIKAERRRDAQPALMRWSARWPPGGGSSHTRWLPSSLIRAQTRVVVMGGASVSLLRAAFHCSRRKASPSRAIAKSASSSAGSFARARERFKYLTSGQVGSPSASGTNKCSVPSGSPAEWLRAS